jgi:hypothetical protein
MTFKQDSKFTSSYKMENALISYSKAIERFGEGTTGSMDDKCSNQWGGTFTTRDGTEIRVSFWDWKGGLGYGCGVSIWVDTPKYLSEFKAYIES